jgi:hypothetical protein
MPLAGTTSNEQFLYVSKGPLDPKAVTKTYANLTNSTTWLDTSSNKLAYNGMIVTVWGDTNTSNNGVYFLYDPACTSALKPVTTDNETYWHKLGEIPEIVATASELPATGVANKFYIVTDEAKMYIWHNGDYLAVGGASSEGESTTITAITNEEIDDLWEDPSEDPEDTPAE